MSKKYDRILNSVSKIRRALRRYVSAATAQKCAQDFEDAVNEVCQPDAPSAHSPGGSVSSASPGGSEHGVCAPMNATRNALSRLELNF
mmetsp:Transcript_19158/g.68134  ORF Transcript_19158/g.68134 Transcript_19158/m.68134 type:complete len:88 (+) Transcript_19158:794-1057(+)